ncbi:3D domain-containing protein [Psychroflexus sediminis]|uniref:3D (Asp-Asp-Asp) domain-containing protein n=1 Tax=Psychroflexus sediminis TaxID=470826 RepID=A0A1G7U2B6_9FLAO|nr:3D domain-containing protein [Psychroflexus sediminis]SDG41633.1 3D (Asp-Asp-Asp) domain-containing protein [Psychroflexus sediminis]
MTYNYLTNKLLTGLSIVVLLLFSSCKNNDNAEEITMTVTASAYNSVEAQTKKGNPNLTAWGDILEPGEKSIAVSRDLIDMGLDHNQEVKIKGLPGTYIVKDKMNRRWTNKIDIYMGIDEEAAKEWGKKEVEITYVLEEEETDQVSK